MNLQQNNHDRRIQDPLQRALFQAAKIGNINLVREFIKAGGSPFIHDEDGRNALSYAIAANPSEASSLVMELDKGMSTNAEASNE